MSEPSAGDRERKELAGRAGIVALGTLASRILGLVRDMALAAQFTRAATDAWMIAFQIPNMLRQVLAEGAVQTAVMPVLAEAREQSGDEAAKRFFAALRGIWLLLCAVVSVVGILLAPWLVDLFASGFRARPGQFELTVQLTQWVFPYIFFMGSASLGVAALNLHRRFVATSFAPALLNVAFIAASFGVPAWLVAGGYPAILAMALAALVGGALQVIAQWPSLSAIGYLRLTSLDFREPLLGKVFARLVPTFVGVGVYYVDVIIGRRLLSELGEGAVTYFGYALRLCDFSQGIFVMALSTATLPTLSAFVARGELGEVSKTSAYALRHALFIGIAASALFVVLAEPIVALLLGRGEFDAASVRETALALVAQALGIFLVAGVRQVVIVYYALGDTKTPVQVAAVDVVVFALSAWLLRDSLGHVGVSLAVSITRVVQFGLLYLGLERRLPERQGSAVLGSALRSLVVASLAGGATYAATLGAKSAGIGAAPVAVLGSVLFGATFWAAAAALRSPELDTIVHPILARLAGRR